MEKGIEGSHPVKFFFNQNNESLTCIKKDSIWGYCLRFFVFLVVLKKKNHLCVHEFFINKLLYPSNIHVSAGLCMDRFVHSMRTESFMFYPGGISAAPGGRGWGIIRSGGGGEICIFGSLIGIKFQNFGGTSLFFGVGKGVNKINERRQWRWLQNSNSLMIVERLATPDYNHPAYMVFLMWLHRSKFLGPDPAQYKS